MSPGSGLTDTAGTTGVAPVKHLLRQRFARRKNAIFRRSSTASTASRSTKILTGDPIQPAEASGQPAPRLAYL
jgi:hypothetical protein